MRRLLFTLALLIYSVPDDFDITAFLARCKTQGIKLYADHESDSPHGSIHWDGGILRVDLFESPQAAIPADARKRRLAQAGRAVLAGDIGVHIAEIDAAVDAAKR